MAAVTPAMQDYLKAIYKLHVEAVPVTTQHIADRLGVASPSVTKMVKRLDAMGFVDHTLYHGVTLTPSGEQIAIEVIRHHRLLERYLVEKLGYAVEEVHAEAEELEHYLSEELEAHIDMALGYPTADPHGDPIPSPEGLLADSVGHSLASLEVGVPGIIVRVSDADPVMLRYLAGLGVLPGTPVMVLETLSARSSLRVRLGANEADCLLSPELAAIISVQILTDWTMHSSNVEDE